MGLYGGIFDVENRRFKIKEQEQLTLRPDFWDHSEKAEAVQKAIKANKLWVDEYEVLENGVLEIETLLEFQKEGEAV